MGGIVAIVAMPLAWCGQARGSVAITGGHDTDPRDMGRPVVLIAAGLGVPTEVFREAFTHVSPEPGGGPPDPERVHRNKETLLTALGPYGVTNDQLDRVSDYYRYNARRGEVWRQTPARVAPIQNSKGVVTGFKILNGGSGYSSAPFIAVPGRNDVHANVKLSFSQNLSRNGSIASITIVKRS
jgi:hypothetical protein